MAAEAIVSTVLEQLTSIIVTEAKKEVRLVVGVKKEIKKLTTKFEAIKAVLVDAEQRQVKEKETVGVWLDRLKAASYDIDDILDEWNTEILELQIEEDANAQFWKNVCFLFPYPCFCFRQIALRHNTGVKIKEINDELDSIAIDKGQFSLNAIRSIEEPQRLKTTSFVEVSEIRGREEEKNDLVNKLSESKQDRASLPVILLVGLGGIGKTTLAQLAYNDAEIETKFDHRIWVCVSDPFDEVRIARAILRGFKVEATNLDDEFQSLLERIRETIVNKKFLLILDDVWTEDYDKWGPLYNSLNDGLHGESKIVVTTRKETVARMMKSTDIINIGVLSLDESWSLFTQLAFWDRSHEECEELENIGRAIVGKCKGLPLAIKTIGSLLRCKKTRNQWQRISDDEIWTSKELENLFPPLLLSYNDLPFMVKRCFSYCAIFPKDYVMRKNELIKLWMAQGYFGLELDKELEIIGEDYFDTLAMHSFFQEFEKDDDGNIKCKMHDIVHDFALFLVKNECFSKEIYGGEEASLDVSCEKARYSMLILKSSYNVNISSVQKLRSLLIEDGHRSRSMSCFSPDLFEQMTCLRSLKLSGSWDNKIPREIGKLIHLRYLNMSRLQIKELPETLCCLYNLQTLDISDCESLKKLPQGMGKLINLRHLLNSGTSELRYMPKGIERLVCLRTLDRLIVGGDPNGMGLGCLKNMNKLRGYLWLEGLREVKDEAEAKNAQLMNKKNLVELLLWFNGGSDISSAEECNKDSAVLEALQPPPNLERLDICKCRSISLSPHWMVSLTHLKTLTLQSCRNCEYLPALGKLPRLEDLRIRDMERVKRVGNEFVGIETSSSSSSSSSSRIAFPKLKTLQIESMKNWEEWEYKITARDITIMPSLSELEIHWCPKLKSLPDQLLHATSLEKLDINGCNCEYLPALGKLPRLECLEITGMESVKRVGNEFVGIETSSSSSTSSSPSLIAFPKLKTLRILNMENWEEWEYKITAGDITIMPSLSELEIRWCLKLKSLPDQLLHATSLEKLDINGCNCEYLPALGKLPRLECLEITGMESVKRVGNEFVGIETSSSSSTSSSPSLIAFPKLKTLRILNMENWEEWEYKITAGDITIMPSLSELRIFRCPKLKSLPDQLLHATTLETLHICDCNCEYLPALGKLPRLEYLQISEMKSMKRVGNEFVGIETSSSSSSSSSPSLIAFPKLNTLRFSWMENWEEWEYKITARDITIMPSLSELLIWECPKLKSLPDHLLHATTLETLDIFDRCDSLEQVYEVESPRSGEKWSATIKKKIERCNEESNAIQN